MKRAYRRSLLLAILACPVSAALIGCAATRPVDAPAQPASDRLTTGVLQQEDGRSPAPDARVVTVADKAKPDEGPGRGQGRRPAHTPPAWSGKPPQAASGTASAGGIPPHDECEDCIPVSTGVPYSGSTDGATGNDITSCTDRDTADVWHCWTADCTGNATFSLCGSAFDTSVAVFDSCGGDELGCDYDSCVGALQSQLTIPVTAGKTYYVRVAGHAGATGSYTLNVTCVPMGACCVDGNCTGVMREDVCLENGGTWHPAEDCATVNCPQPETGACCAGHVCTSGFDCGQQYPIFCNGTSRASW